MSQGSVVNLTNILLQQGYRRMRNNYGHCCSVMFSLVSIFFALVLVPVLVFAQQEPSVSAQGGDVPEGMEVVQVTGGYRLIVPEGAKTRRVGAQIIVEGDKEYYSRRFHELSQEIAGLKAQIEQLKEQMSELKKNSDKPRTEKP